jgi:hypothetical protein
MVLPPTNSEQQLLHLPAWVGEEGILKTSLSMILRTNSALCCNKTSQQLAVVTLHLMQLVEAQDL